MDDPTRPYGGSFLKRPSTKTVRRIRYHPYPRYGPRMDSFLTPPLVSHVKYSRGFHRAHLEISAQSFCPRIVVFKKISECHSCSTENSHIQPRRFITMFMKAFLSQCREWRKVAPWVIGI